VGGGPGLASTSLHDRREATLPVAGGVTRGNLSGEVPLALEKPRG